MEFVRGYREKQVNPRTVINLCFEPHFFQKWIRKYIKVHNIRRIRMNHTLWPSCSSALNPLEHLWMILEWCVRQHSPPPSSKHQLKKSSELYNECQGKLKLSWWLVVANPLINTFYIAFSPHKNNFSQIELSRITDSDIILVIKVLIALIP